MEREIRINQRFVGSIGAQRLITPPFTEENTKVVIDGDVRMVKNIDTGSIIYEKKKLLSRIERPMYSITESSETSIPPRLVLMKNIVYRKRRIMNMGNYELHVTNRITPSGSSVSIELEGDASEDDAHFILKKMYGELYHLIPAFKTLAESLRIYLQTPIDLEWRNLTSSILKRGISYKADGIRALLFLTEKGEFLMTSAGEILPRSTRSSPLSVYDCELIGEKIIIFDVLFHEGKDVREMKLIDRLKITVPHERKVIKFPSSPDDFFKIVKEMASMEGDGVIFTHPGSYTESPFKWKPVNMLTIDYFVNEKGQRGLFWRDFVYPDLPLVEGKVFIGEFLDDTLIRVRDDKVAPNSYQTFKNITRLKKDPITLDAITGNSLRLMRKYHNRLKRRLYLYLEKCGVQSITDIGSGKFGDLSSWLRFKHINAVEPYDVHYNAAIERAASAGFNIHDDVFSKDGLTIKLFREGGETFKEVRSDALTFFNSLTFINEETLKRLASTSDIIITMYIDGNKLRSIIPQMNNHLIQIKMLDDHRIHINMEGSTVHDQIENIIDPAFIARALEGFILDYDFYAVDETLMGPIEKLYSSCQRIQVWRRPTPIGQRERILPLTYPHTEEIMTPYGLYTRYGVTTVEEFNDLFDLKASLKNTVAFFRGEVDALIPDGTWKVHHVLSENTGPQDKMILNNDIYYEPIVRYKI